MPSTMPSGTRKSKAAVMSAPRTRAPRDFKSWVTKVVALVSAGPGHPVRWLTSSRSGTVDAESLLATLPSRPGPSSEKLTTVSVVELMQDGDVDTARHADHVAWLASLPSSAQADLGLTVVRPRNDSRSHGAARHKLRWVGPHPSDGIRAHASPGDYLDNVPLGNGVALCVGETRRGKRILQTPDHAGGKKTCRKKISFNNANATGAEGLLQLAAPITTPHVLHAAQAWQRSVLAPVENFLAGPHGSQPRKPTVRIGRGMEALVEARMEAVVGCAAAINGVPRQLSTPDDEQLAAATLVSAAKHWGVSPAALAKAAQPSRVDVAVTAADLTGHYFGSPGWTMTTLRQHIRLVDGFLNPIPSGRVRRPKNTPRSIPVATMTAVRAYLLSLPLPGIRPVAEMVPGSEHAVGTQSVAMCVKEYLEALLESKATQAAIHHELFADRALVLMVGLDGARVTDSGNVGNILTTVGLMNMAAHNHSVAAACPVALLPVSESHAAIAASLEANFGELARAGGAVSWRCCGPTCARCRAGDAPTNGQHTAQATTMFTFDLKAALLALGLASNCCVHCCKPITAATNARMLEAGFSPDAEFPVSTIAERRAHAAAHSDALERYLRHAHPNGTPAAGIDINRFEASKCYTEWAQGPGREGLKCAGVLLDSLTSPWQVTPDALHILLYLGRVICQEVAEMMKIIEHALGDQLGTGIGYVTGIRALYACGMTRAAFIMEQRYRAVMAAAAKGAVLGTTECGLPVDNRSVKGYSPANPPLTVDEAGREAAAYVAALDKKKATYISQADGIAGFKATGTLAAMREQLKMLVVAGLICNPRTIKNDELVSGDIPAYRAQHRSLSAQAARVAQKADTPVTITAEQADTICADPKAMGGDIITLLRNKGMDKLIGTLNATKVHATATLTLARRQAIEKLRRLEGDRDKLLEAISAEADSGEGSDLEQLEDEMEAMEEELVKISRDQNRYDDSTAIDPALANSVDHLRNLEAMALPLWTGNTVDGEPDSGDGDTHRQRAMAWFKALTISKGSTKATYAHVLVVELPRYLDWLAAVHPGLPFRCFTSQRAEHANKTNKKRMVTMLGSADGNRHTGESCYGFRLRHESIRIIYYCQGIPVTHLGKTQLKELLKAAAARDSN